MRIPPKNELLIGITLSALLSLFVNFSLLMRNYERYSSARNPPETFPLEDYFLYFSLLWFFIFAFLLFITNRQLYRLGSQWFRTAEYKNALCSGLVSTALAFGLFQLYPLAHTISMDGWLKERPEATTPWRAESQTEMRKIPIPCEDGREYVLVTSSKQGAGWPWPLPPPLATEHLFVWLTVILSVWLMRLLGSKQQMQLAYEQLKTEKLQSSYNALMGQIHPHFFFNSLNGLNALIRGGEQEKTLRYLDELSQVFRYILQSNKKELVPLAEELQFVKAYTYLLGVRYEGKLFFSIQADPTCLLWYLPILSILPLIENAVKHNVVSKQYPLQIDVYTTPDHQLVVSNKIRSKAEESAGSGIGLRNLWGRYQMLTGHDIYISKRKEYFKVSLPLLPSPAHASF